MGFVWGRPSSVNVGSKRLETLSLGPSPQEAPTLVLLHEGLGCCALWRGFPEALQAATGLGVLAYSRAGYGASDGAELPRPLDYMTREAVDVLPEVLNATGVARGVLIGHSDGASIAALYAGSRADPRVKALVLMAPHFFTEPHGLAAIERAAEAYRSTDLKARLGRYHRDPDQAFLGWNEAWLDPKFATWRIDDCLDGIEIPILAVQGDDDEYGTLAQLDIIAARSKGRVSREIYADCGHAPHLDQPEAVLKRIAAFVATHLDGKTGPDWRPDYAHLPGRNPRHPEDLFDWISPGSTMSQPAEIPASRAWEMAMVLLRDGYFWEAHEVLEPLWMACPQNSAEGVFLRGVIQLSNAKLKARMGQPRAAQRLLKMARDLLKEASQRNLDPAFDRMVVETAEVMDKKSAI